MLGLGIRVGYKPVPALLKSSCFSNNTFATPLTQQLRFVNSRPPRGKSLPKKLKGKLFWKRHDDRGKADAKEQARRGNAEVERQVFYKANVYKPKTELQKLHFKLFENTKNRRVGVNVMYQMISMVSEKLDITYPLTVLHEMVYEGQSFKEDTLQKLAEMLFKYDEHAAVAKLVYCKNYLKMPINGETILYIIDNLVKAGITEDIPRILKAITTGRDKPLTSKDYESILEKVPDQIIPFYSTMHPGTPVHLSSTYYDTILNGIDQVEKKTELLKRIQLDLLLKENKDEQDEQVLSRVKELLNAKSETEQGEENKEEDPQQ
ncbi:ribonuclease H [Acrasis kona]|uniref:Ribonuclease H n=1 Tax=Acrasis kona TaxID=1008807 RepID=A0AAW2YZ66_9EUKA